MELISTQTPLFNPVALFSDGNEELQDSPIIAVFDPDELSFELGVWLSGLESFLTTGGGPFGDRNQSASPLRSWDLECRLTRAALLQSSKLNFRLRKAMASQKLHDGSGSEDNYLSVSELDSFALVLRDSIVLNESILSSGGLDFGDWRGWSAMLNDTLKSSPVFHKLLTRVRVTGEQFLPERLNVIMAEKAAPFADQVDLKVILPQFGAILGLLSVVGRMLKNDEPLKPSLLIFSRVYEETQSLISHMNNRLSRFSDESAAMFNSLDSASYTASLELKKVCLQELNGLAGIRPVPSVFARVETACELLSDSFRQILADFAHVVDPDLQPSDLFPNFKTKLEQSLELRRDLWQLLQTVRKGEQNPDKNQLDNVTKQLREFLERTLSFLFHKDRETLERFSEEIFVTTEKKDIVPILHRFGAYLETLLAQINMRTVLADHPFKPE
ncbi:MAG TPA: hypothetical protein VFZ23_14690 [Pyrinomonadaceae bacterium]